MARNIETRPFPGRIKRDSNNTIVFNKWQENWLRKYYPFCTNKKITQLIGISEMTLKRIVVGMGLVKDEEWKYYDRCKRIGKVEDINRVTKQTGTISISTKLSRRDYGILKEVSRDKGLTKYEWIQRVIRHELHAFVETKYPQPLLF